MSVQDHDHRAYRPQPGVDLQGRLSPFWRALSELVLRLEHGFERARADARPEDDTRVRIFLITLVFSVVFAGLAVGAGYRALFAESGGRWAGGNPNALVRGDLTDRNGQLLAANIIHYGLYIDPREVWDRDLAARQIRRALPRVSAARLKKVLGGDRRLVVLNGLTPGEKAAVHDLALGGVTFEPEDRRAYPLGAAERIVVVDAQSRYLGLVAVADLLGVLGGFLVATSLAAAAWLARARLTRLVSLLPGRRKADVAAGRDILPQGRG